MTVTVLYFAGLRELAGRESAVVELADGSSVRELMEVVGEGVGRYAGCLAVAVNREYAGWETVLRDGDEVGLLPPVSGGANGVGRSTGRDKPHDNARAARVIMGHPEGWGAR